MVKGNSIDIGSSMEIIRQRLFIDHDNKNQRQITVEYTIRSKLPKLKNIFLNYEKFLPSLVIQDEKNSQIPLMPSRDVEILYQYHIDKTNSDEKSQLQSELQDIRSNKKYLIWISLKKQPLSENEIKIFTLSYLPEIKNVKKPEIFIKINKQNYPVYYSLFSPNSFNFNKPKFTILTNNGIEIKKDPPEYVNIYNSYQSMALRVPTNIDYDFSVTYSLTPLPSSKVLTQLCSFFLLALPVSFFIIPLIYTSGFEPFFQKQVEVALFVIGASLLLPNIQPDHSIRRRLMLWYLLPIILGLIMVFS